MATAVSILVLASAAGAAPPTAALGAVSHAVTVGLTSSPRAIDTLVRAALGLDVDGAMRAEAAGITGMSRGVSPGMAVQACIPRWASSVARMLRL